MAGGIFISYRRDDSRHAAGRLVDRLGQTFAREQLFMDVDNIDLGLDFVKVLGEKVAACDVMLVVIGPQWIDAKDAQGRRRLDDPHDFVRIEVEQALARDVRVIPVLVDGAQAPRVDELPPSLQPLARRQATTIAHERFGSDADRIVEALERIVTGRLNPVSSGQDRLHPINVAPQTGQLVTPEMIKKVMAEVGSLDRTYYAPKIPDVKAANARASIHMPASVEMYVLFDDTVFGSAKNGIIVGSTGLFHRPLGGEADTARWAEFLACPVVSNWSSIKVAGKSWNMGSAKESAVKFLALLKSMALMSQ